MDPQQQQHAPPSNLESTWQESDAGNDKQPLSDSDRIRVCVRVRPLNERESAINSVHVWHARDEQTLYHCNPQRGAIVDSNSPMYTFDRVFSTESTTLDLYSSVARDIVMSACHGFNGTIFAYGQTSSGKTHTMKGDEKEPGVIGHAVNEIFQYIAGHPTREFLLRVSYLEIYNENIVDLLQPGNVGLKIHESLERGIYVGELREEVVASPEQVMQLMEYGETHRRFGATNMNERSSRSHTIFRVSLESREKSTMEEEEEEEGEEHQTGESEQNDTAVLVSTLNLVDLAGSERSSQTMAEGVRLTEGNHINKSLLTLGTVIAKLSSEGNRAAHIPYRDSKLTRILQPALGGNSRTAIICTITPALIHTEETHSSLKFANRAKSITNRAHINEVMNDQAVLKRTKQEKNRLKQQCEELQVDLRRAEEENQVLEHRSLSLQQQVQDLQNKFQNNVSVWQEKYETLSNEMNQACESWSKRYESLQQEFTDAKLSWQQKQEQMTFDVEKANDIRGSKCIQFEQQVKQLQERVNNVEQENAYFKSKNGTMQKQLQEQEMHFLDQFEQLNTEKRTLKERVQEMETIHQQVQSQVHDMGGDQAQKQRNEAEIRDIQQKLVNVEETLIQERKQHGQHIAQLNEEWQTKLDKAIKNVKASYKEQSEKSEQDQKAKEKAMESKLASVRKELKEEQATLIEDQRKTLMESWEAEQVQTQVEISALRQKFEEAKAESLQWKTQANSAISSTEDLRKQLNEEKKEKDEFIAELAMHREKPSKVEKDLEEVKLEQTQDDPRAEQQAQIKDGTKRMDRLKEAFQRKIHEFRSLVFRLFGFRIDIVEENKFKLHANRNEHLIVEFDHKAKKLRLCEMHFTRTEIQSHTMEEWKSSFPTFMSLLTLELLAYKLPRHFDHTLETGRQQRQQQQANNIERQPLALLKRLSAGNILSDTEDQEPIHSEIQNRATKKRKLDAASPHDENANSDSATSTTMHVR